jgi:hypothetical protein|tara:strand:+ start:8639 stop:9490 length:852 start_codon:yes stop_codon:yes gene_type:complete
MYIMDSIDLNLDNYELTDLLTLFNLQYDFTESDLKNAKKIVLKTHPDKSNLPKEYFLFFSKAYKIIYSIYEFRVKGKGSTEYMLDESTDVEIFKKLTGKKDFNKVFNELFDKCNVRTAETDTGYGEWLRSDEDMDNTVTTKENMHDTFRKKKTVARDAIVNQSIQETGYNTYTDLLGNAPDNYSSDLFSSLGYEDLRNAHRENVIPVTEKDIKQTFKNQEELRIYRESQKIIPNSLSESKEMLHKQKQQEIKQDTQRAYTLAKQDELYKDINANFMSNLYKLT